MTAAAPAPDQAARDTAAEQGKRMVRLLEERGYLSQILGSDPAAVERFRTVMLSALTGSPKLLAADQASLVQAMREAAMWGLEPDGVDAVIVPFWNSRASRYEADFQPTARGYVQVLYRSPRVRFVDADVVYANDDFEYEKGAVPRLVHRPLVFGERGELIGAYAVVQLDSGFVRPIVLNREQIEKRRKVARDSERGPWQDWEDEMWRKTALRSIMSLVPIARGVKAALAAESEKYQSLAPGESAPQVGATSPLPSLEAARGAFLALPEPAAEPKPEKRGKVPEPQEPAEDAEVVEVPEDWHPAPEAVQNALCAVLSPYEGSAPCTFLSGHKGHHKAATAETWA